MRYLFKFLLPSQNNWTLLYMSKTHFLPKKSQDLNWSQYWFEFEFWQSNGLHFNVCTSKQIGLSLGNQGGHLDLRINLESIITFRGPLFQKPGTDWNLFLDTQYIELTNEICYLCGKISCKRKHRRFIKKYLERILPNCGG